MIAPETVPSALVPVVVGAHLRAELGDRVAAAWLADRLDASLAALGSPLRGCVLTDLWHLNDQRLASRPAISVGGPEVNALTAYLADKLPSVISHEGVMVVQLDLEFRELMAACWGNSPEATARACALFEARHLASFARAVAAAG